MRCYLFDLDGTLFDITHRLHFIRQTPKNWDAFFDACSEDKPILHMIGVANALAGTGAINVFVSGRAERCRQKTQALLKEHLPSISSIWMALYMRKDGDYRPDNEVKSEMLDQILADGYKPIMAFDDRTQVVKMWRERGIPCAQVAEGDF